MGSLREQKKPWYKSDKQLLLVTVEIKPSFHSGLIPTVPRKSLFILYICRVRKNEAATQSLVEKLISTKSDLECATL